MARTLSLEARSKVLTAAREVLYERGLDGFTIDAVAERSGVAKTTIYRHFSGVHVLLIEALHAMLDPVPTPNTGSLRDDLVELFLRRLPLVANPHLRPIVLGLLSASAHDPDLDRVATTMTAQRTQPIRTVVELAIGRGEIPPDTDVDLAADLIEGPFFVHVFVHRLSLDAGQIEALIDLAVAGLVHGTPHA